MEAAAVDRLVQKGEFRPEVAQAIGEAIDIAITAANVVTIPVLDARFAAYDAKMEARFAAHDAKMEARFGSIEKSIESTKVWATLLYAGLTLALFSALAVDHHWLVNREDQLIAQLQTRTDARFVEQDARSDRRFQQVDQRFQQVDQRFQEVDRRFQEMDAKLDQIRALILGTPLRRDGLTRPSPTTARPRGQ